MSQTVRMNLVERHPSGYRYIVTLGSSSWTAFHTRQGMREFMRFYGLKISYDGRRDKVTRWGRCANFTLAGNFTESLMMDQEKFDSIVADATSWRFDNGERTLWKAVRTPNGTHVCRLNANVRTRPVVKYYTD